MLPIILFIALLPPSLFLKYFYAGPDTTDIAVLSSVAVYATLVIGTTYIYRLSERSPADALLDLNIVPARPVAEAPTCAVYKTSLTRTFSPARPFVLTTISSCPNRAIYPKFEWAPVSAVASSFLQPTCKIAAGPPVLPASSSDLHRSSASSNTALSLGVAVLILIVGLYFVGLEAASWLEKIDEEHLAKLALAKDLAIVEPDLQVASISELDVPTLETPILDVPTGEAPVKPKSQPSPLKPAKCRRAGSKRVAHARPLASTPARPSSAKKKTQA